MENPVYATLGRQSGLLKEMTTVANNLANMSTSGYRREGMIFSEFVRDTGPGFESLSMANGNTRRTIFDQGALTLTGSEFDFAIEGEGFFQVETADGPRLTRAGAFTPGPDGLLAAPDGALLLDAGGAPIFIPPDAKGVTIGADGTLAADGNPVAQIGVWRATDPLSLRRDGGVRFDAGADIAPAEEARVLQGYAEASNVDPVLELTRMIEVQRAYELGQTFLDREDERVRGTIRTIGQ